MRATFFLDLPNILRGLLFSTYAMWGEVSALDLTKTVPALQMPVVFFVGRHDHVIAPKTSVAFFNMLSAPAKRLEWFRNRHTNLRLRSRRSSTRQSQNWSAGRRPIEIRQVRLRP